MKTLKISCLATTVYAFLLLTGPAANAATERLLYSFCSKANCDDGAGPEAALKVAGGELYGTASWGGQNEGGTAFSYNPRSGDLKTLHSFGDPISGSLPENNLLNVNGTLYGLTHAGGVYNYGTLFSLDRKTGAENVLHSFGGGADGAYPGSGDSLIVLKEKLYGTTYAGGNVGCGTVFSIDPMSGNEKIVHSFGPNDNINGSGPASGLVELNGILYGTTYYGGTAYSGSDGILYSIDPKTGIATVLYNFQGYDNGDGQNPEGGLLVYKGLLYGTTQFGGNNAPGCGNGVLQMGCGTVFSFDPKTGIKKNLYFFAGGVWRSGTDGALPMGGLVNLHGTLYGTTQNGGGTRCPNGGCGAVFSIDPQTGGETVVHAFHPTLYPAISAAPDGMWPMAGLTVYRGALYGTTQRGGNHGAGMIFEVTP